MRNDASLRALSELAAVSWKLRDTMIARGAFDAEVVRLENAAHSLDEALAKLQAVMANSNRHEDSP
ncbi:hypothetical protein [Acidisphaera sp. L21]|jgi:hypothetical protein|uniref:hypothetical protein n=1 Tax=Acidisphaera sp. L21 TaxID=1641851 RepID=UPI00131E4F56|nr:hypothetical protein [Acidisphaera sp. L21]